MRARISIQSLPNPHDKELIVNTLFPLLYYTLTSIDGSRYPTVLAKLATMQKWLCMYYHGTRALDHTSRHIQNRQRLKYKPTPNVKISWTTTTMYNKRLPTPK